MAATENPHASSSASLLGFRRAGRFSPSAESAEARVVIIGQPSDLHRAVAHPAVESGRFSVVGAFAVDVHMGLTDDKRRIIEQHFDGLDADAIFLAGPVGPSVSTWATDVAWGHGVPLWAVMPTEVAHHADPHVVWTGKEPLVQLAGQPRSPFGFAVKRVLDVMGALAAVVITAPIIAFLSLLIALESRGAPLFRHVRVTRDGRRFGCLKLRTMYANAEERLESDEALYEAYLNNNYKIPEERDPRITRIGRVLRRTSLDELPQFWNVLVGDMSLVGPRPVVPPELEHYPGARRRLLLSMRPGLTGAWAVSGRHGVGYPERADIELAYVREWSLRTDLMVLIKTLRAVLSY
jgi:lipopolysaccharide/colanic/teichoic acid biosynthesis glycosyltransferase